MSQEPVISRALTHAGHIRERNEDAVLGMPGSGLWAVADGMGGHSCGDVASQAVVQALRESGSTRMGHELLRDLHGAMQQVNRSLRELAALEPGAGVIGTTVAVLVLEADNFHCYWAGDSRVYLLRDGGFRRLTRDHAVAAKSATGIQARLTRAVGADDTIELDHVHGHLYEDDVFLLCSDGLTRVVADDRIADLLRTHSPEDACQALLDAALAGGGPDNISCITVHVAP